MEEEGSGKVLPRVSTGLDPQGIEKLQRTSLFHFLVLCPLGVVRMPLGPFHGGWVRKVGIASLKRTVLSSAPGQDVGSPAYEERRRDTDGNPSKLDWEAASKQLRLSPSETEGHRLSENHFSSEKKAWKTCLG